MKIPVILHELCTGQPPDGDITVRATFKTEDAARRVMLAAMSEQRSGQLILVPGDQIFPRPVPTVIEIDSIAAAADQGFEIDMDALQSAWAKSDDAAAATVSDLSVGVQKANA